MKTINKQSANTPAATPAEPSQITPQLACKEQHPKNGLPTRQAQQPPTASNLQGFVVSEPWTKDPTIIELVDKLDPPVKTELTNLGKEGFNNHVLKVANMLIGNGLTPNEAFQLLRESGNQYNDERTVSDEEIWKAVNKASNSKHVKREHKWPEKSQKDINAALDKQFEQKDTLTKDSSVGISSPEEALKILFELDDLITLGKDDVSKGKSPETRTLKEWLKVPNLESYAYIVPNPARKTNGLTKDGKTSKRCADMFPERVYMVIEFDSLTKDKQTGIINHLINKKFPVCMVLDSGGKSLHAWVSTTGATEDRARDAMSIAAKLGADTSMFTPCQWARLPFGTRSNGKEQTVLAIYEPNPESFPELLKDGLIEDYFDNPWTPTNNYLIKGVMDAKTTTVIYGQPGCGKSFVAIAMGMAIANGKDWNTKRVKQGGVLYIALEGQAGLKKRLAGNVNEGIFTKKTPFKLITKYGFQITDKGDRKQLLDEIEKMEKLQGFKFELIIIDTLAKTMLGEKEDNEGMTKASMGATNLCEDGDCAVLLIAHEGKTEGKGIRGGSSITGGVETIILASKEENYGSYFVNLQFDKQKDDVDTLKLCSKLHIVNVGEDEDGDMQTTCLAVDSQVGVTPASGKQDIQKNKYLELLPQPTKTAWIDAAVGCGLGETTAASKSWISRNLKDKQDYLKKDGEFVRSLDITAIIDSAEK